VDAGTLGVRAAGLSGKRVTALAAAPDGRAVYAVVGSRLLRLDPRSLGLAGEVPLSGSPAAILRVT
jgi:hypothetical protein